MTALLVRATAPDCDAGLYKFARGSYGLASNRGRGEQSYIMGNASQCDRKLQIAIGWANRFLFAYPLLLVRAPEGCNA